LVGATLISAISWLDDLYSLSNRVRFSVHTVAAIFVILVAGFPLTTSVSILGNLKLGLLGIPLTFLWIVGLTNAYNFMDGIDGIAGGQAVVAGIGWTLIGILTDLPFVTVLGGLLAATALGFLFHNWPPAKIFMGDVGSAFLGFSFAYLAIISANREPFLGIVGVLLVWPFVFDTIFTFLRRLKNRENIFSAHRSHLYQRLAISGYSHRTVALLYVGLDILGLIFALLLLSKNTLADLCVMIALLLSCGGLWAFTVIREQAVLQAKNSNGALEKKLV
jgi:UDP-N-acetylmuramyl pentapeptide phosphotransferase/UDP-N-acetylglucosamine-1-phosphate transferase